MVLPRYHRRRRAPRESQLRARANSAKQSKAHSEALLRVCVSARTTYSMNHADPSTEERKRCLAPAASHETAIDHQENEKWR
jgi:hypothetical protein